MPYCVKCGASTDKPDNYCANCGVSQVEIGEEASYEKSSGVLTALIILLLLVLALAAWYLASVNLRSDRSSTPIPIQEGADGYNENGASRSRELEAIKSKALYEDPVLQHLGLTKSEIISIYGEPRIVDHWGPGGEEYLYDQKGLAFIFAGAETDVVNNMMLSPRFESTLFGVKIGMTFTEIKKILGEPIWAGLFEEGSDYGDYGLIYYFGDRKDMESEIVVQFFSQADDGPTHIALILWKAYWW